MNRSKRLAARLWWATLPYYGWASVTADEIADGARPAPWYAHPLAWLHRLVDKLPSSAPFKPVPEVKCDCDECRGAAQQLAWMDYMDRVAQEELGARPRGEVMVELSAGPVSTEEER